MESIDIADFEHLAGERLDPGLFEYCLSSTWPGSGSTPDSSNTASRASSA
jgi:hypothetical protein